MGGSTCLVVYMSIALFDPVRKSRCPPLNMNLDHFAASSRNDFWGLQILHIHTDSMGRAEQC